MTTHDLIKAEVSQDTTRQEPIDYIGNLKAMGDALAEHLSRFQWAFFRESFGEPMALIVGGHVVDSVEWHDSEPSDTEYRQWVVWDGIILPGYLAVDASILWSFITTN